MFALARSAGWIAQWREFAQDAAQKAVRQQVYIGADASAYVPLTKRGWRIFTTSVYRRAFLHKIFTTAVR
jgi:hypothetical protein